jgi:ribosome assembly protein YihI (activator of Der GTPase)
MIMVQKSEVTKLHAAQQLKREELQIQEAKLKELHAELEKLNSKIHNNEKLSAEDTQYIGELGWLAALSVTIAAIAAGI